MNTDVSVVDGVCHVVVTPETKEDVVKMRSILLRLGLHPEEWENTDEMADIPAQFIFRTSIPE